MNEQTSIGVRVLSRLQGQIPYKIEISRTREVIRAAQTLRFLVFNLELNEGLEQSYSTCLDADPFDEICDHLVVRVGKTDEIVGTYRLQTGAVAAANRGYYSAQEFDFAPYEAIRGEIVELGRACVHRDHRNLAVLSQLWGGIYKYCQERGARYLIGCSSLTSQDPSVGIRVFNDLSKDHLAEEKFRTLPLPAFACPDVPPAAKALKVPKLLAAYLSLGAKICGAPAIDREFKTIDFLTLLDLGGLSQRTIERYLA